MYRALITGSRNWVDLTVLTRLLDLRLHDKQDVVIVHGDAAGADKMAAHWAEAHHLRIEAHPVTKENWEIKPRSAGIIRNAHMVSLGADICLAFPMPCTKVRCDRPEPHISHGTAHCIHAAQHAGIETVLAVPGDWGEVA